MKHNKEQNPPLETQEFNIEMGFYENRNKNNMYKGKEPNKVKNKCSKWKETIEPIEIEKLQENNKWVIKEEERRWTYVVDDPWNVHATWRVEKLQDEWMPPLESPKNLPR